MFGKLALCTALGAAIAGCHAGQDGSAAASDATPTAAASPVSQAASAVVQAVSPAVQAVSPARSAVASPASAPNTAAAVADVGVVADCASAEPHTLSREPSSIVLTCADAGIRIEGLTWVTWTDSAAAGHGTLWENQCVPSCAEGKFAKYPVAVALFAVRSSADGPWFSRLKLTWAGNRPPNQTPDTWTLMPPGSGPMPL
jgi:hypothetical protein